MAEDKPPHNRGKPPTKDINWDLVDELLTIQCTGEEISSCLGIDYDTLERRVKSLHGESYADWSKKKMAGGRSSLRRAQWHKATVDMNPAMLIWLGKNMLDQSDKSFIDGEIAVFPRLKYDPRDVIEDKVPTKKIKGKPEDD